MKHLTQINALTGTLVLFGTLILGTPVFAMEPGSMMMEESGKGMMMQEEKMTPDEMIQKGEKMIAEGKVLKKKGEKMKKMEMKKDKRMMDQGMKDPGMEKNDTMKMGK